MDFVGKTIRRELGRRTWGATSQYKCSDCSRLRVQHRSVRNASTAILNNYQTPARQTRVLYNLQIVAKHSRATHRSISTNPTYSYGVAASFNAKNVRYNPGKDFFEFHPKNPIFKNRIDKFTRPVSGQDAFFVSTVGSDGGLALGVADGVGGWADSGIDPADFSHAFCDYMAYTAHEHADDAKAPNLSARALMQKGYDDVVAEGSIYAGGSTACVGVARPDGTLDVANLGDSGFLQLRLNAVHKFTDPQTHAFNTPFQLSVIPEVMRARESAFGGVQLQDFPKDAVVTKYTLRHGDILIFATDGVWDNLSSSDVLRIVSRLMVKSGAWEHTEDGIRVTKHLKEQTHLDVAEQKADGKQSLQSVLAVGIAGEAKAASVNTKVDGPFAKEVQRYYPEEDWTGGKVDDICVVTAIVVEDGISA